MKLVLGSSSTSRKILMEKIGYKPDEIYSPDIDETPQKRELPHKLALRLAIQKAEKTHEFYTNKNSNLNAENDIVVVSADTVAARGKIVLPKAIVEEDAVYCMEMLSGRRHDIFTGVCCIRGDRKIFKVVRTKVKFKVLSEEEINFLVSSREWYGTAGGYRVDGIMGIIVSWTNGAHVSNVSGLPVHDVYGMLMGLGVKPRIS